MSLWNPAKEEDLAYLRCASHVQGEQECPSSALCQVALGRSVPLMGTVCTMQLCLRGHRAAAPRTHSLGDLAASPLSYQPPNSTQGLGQPVLVFPPNVFLS